MIKNIKLRTALLLAGLAAGIIFLPYLLRIYYGENLLSAYFSHIDCPHTKFHHSKHKKYYSQYYEDYILSYVFEDAKKGVYVDVGTNNPNKKNVTQYFHKLGWQGINFEPQDKYYRMLTESRPKAININKAVGEVNGVVDLYIPKSDTIATTQFKSDLEHREYIDIKKHPVEMVTLNSVLDKVRLEQIDLLKIDVEGTEHKVLQGIDLSKYRPKVIAVESVSPLNFYGYLESEPILLKYDYKLGMNDGLNRYYYRAESAELSGKFRKIDQCVVLDKMIRGVACQNDKYCRF